VVIATGDVSGIDSYATLSSPALTGTPTVPTATAGTNTTQAASTAFVMASAQPIPTSSTYAVGTMILAGKSSSGSDADNATIAGSNLPAVFLTTDGYVEWISGSLPGTWRNVTGKSLPQGETGYFVRT